MILPIVSIGSRASRFQVLSVADGTPAAESGQTATDQHDFPSSEIAGVGYPNLSNNEMEFRNSYLTRKDFQGPEQTFYDMTTHCQSGRLAGPSIEPLNRSIWNTQDAAQVFIPLEHPSLASAQTAAQS